MKIKQLKQLRTRVGAKLMDWGCVQGRCYINRYNSTTEDIEIFVRDILFWLGKMIHPWPKEK